MKRNIEFYLSEDVKSKLKSKGIYLLTNLKNQKRYVGSTYRDFKERFKEHCGMYNIYLKEGGRIALPILWAAFNKYSLNSFKAEILEIMDDASDQEILNKEEYYIKLLKPEYNICQEPSKNGSPNKNKKLSEEWKKKISEKAKLYKHDKETLALVTENNKQNACKIKFIKDFFTTHISFQFIKVPYDIEKELKDENLNLEKENYRFELEKGMYRDMASINENFKRLGIDVEKI